MDSQEVAKLTLRPTAKKRLGKYMLLGRIGAGGMGKIYLAYTPGPAGIEKLLVIKRLHSHLTNDAGLVGNFLDEARLSMALSHPNIVHTYDVGDAGGRYFIVMEYIEGQNLGVVLRTAKRSGAYPESHIWAGLYLGVLDGLHAAHTATDARGRALNIIHRDISPQNVLITYDGTPKVVDFGIAKAAQRITETDAGVLKGKYAYMSPEQCQSKELDARSDVFAAGIVLWEMLAGRRLYKADSVVKSVERIVREEPFSPLRVNADCDPAIASVVVKALQKRRRDRWSSAEEFRDALEDALRKGGQHYRPSDMRNLMGSLFEDVRARQREVLDKCLAGDLPAYDDSEPGTGSNSKSKSVGKIPLNEDTTPSTSAHSPLITAEGDGESYKLPIENEAAPSAQTDAGQLPPTKVGRHGQVRRSEEAPPPEPSHKSTRGLIAAALIFFLLGAGALTYVILNADGKEAPLVVNDPVEPIEVAPPVTEPPKEVVAEPVPPDPPVLENGLEPLDPDESGELKADATGDKARKKVRKKPRKKLAKAKPKAEPPVVVAPPAPKPAMGKLWLDTVPWTTVYLGKTKLGNTPLVGVDVPVGELSLTLKNAKLGINEGYFVKVKAGAKVRKRLVLE